MSKSSEKINKKIWSHLSDDYNRLVTDVLRPTKSQLKNWQGILSEYGNRQSHLRGLVLGSTPELRDLLLKLGFESYAVDHNPHMLKAMSQLMKCQNSPSDFQINKNWLAMDFKESFFDVVLGDASFNQLTDVQDIHKLLSILKRILKPGGILLIREIVMLSLEPTSKWQETIERYKKGIIKRSGITIELRANSDLKPKGNPQLVDTYKIYLKLEREYQKGNIPDALFDWLKGFYGRGSKLILIYLKDDLKSLLKRYFYLKPIKQPHDYYTCKYMPLFYGINKK